MKISYKNTLFDRLCFHTLHQLYSPLVQAVVISAAALNFWWVSSSESTMAAIAWGLAMYGCMWIGQILFTAIFLMMAKHPALQAEHTLEILERGLREQTSYHQSIHYWRGISKVVNRPGFLAIYIHPHCAHLVPARAFSSMDHYRAFAEQIRSRLSGHTRHPGKKQPGEDMRRS